MTRRRIGRSPFALAPAREPRQPIDAGSEAPPPERSISSLETISIGVTVLAVLATVWAAQAAEALLVPITVGILLSYVLDPLVVMLERRSIPRWLAAVLVLSATVLALGGSAYALRNQAIGLVSQLPSAAQQLREEIERRVHPGTGPVAQVQRAADELKQLSAAPDGEASSQQEVRRVEVEPKSFNVRDFVWSGTMTAAGVAADLVVIGFLALYLMVAGDLFRRRFVEMAGPTLSRKKITLQLLNEISAQISRFLLLRVVISGIVAAGTGLGLWAVGLAQPAAWGVAAGVLNVIPYLGPASIAVGAGLAGFLQFHTLTMAAVASGATIIVSIVEAYVITPWLTSRAAQMNAVAVFIGLVFWGWIWGFPGLILAVPLLMILNAVCDHIEALKPLSALLKE